jgi:hypothetical protein
MTFLHVHAVLGQPSPSTWREEVPDSTIPAGARARPDFDATFERFKGPGACRVAMVGFAAQLSAMLNLGGPYSAGTLRTTVEQVLVM